VLAAGAALLPAASSITCYNNTMATPRETCQCKPGYYSINVTVTTGDECILCEAGFACYGGNDRIPCPRNSTSQAGTSMVSLCKCGVNFEVKR
jgi:hypothetical protein